MKAATIIRRVAKDFYGNNNFFLFNDKMKDGRRSVKVQVCWNYARKDKGSVPTFVDFARECLYRLRKCGYRPVMNPREYRFWV